MLFFFLVVTAASLSMFYSGDQFESGEVDVAMA